MKPHYNLSYQLIARFLLAGLFLQSCNNFSSSVVPQIEKCTDSNSGLTDGLDMNSIVPLELTAQGGHVVSLYEENGILRADVEENFAGNFQKKHQHLPVYVAGVFDLSQIGKQNSKRQQQLATVQLPQGSQQGYVYIGNRGLLGGMKRTITKKGDEEETGEKEKEKEYEGSKPYESPNLSDLRRTRRPTSEQKRAAKVGGSQSPKPAGLPTSRSRDRGKISNMQVASSPVLSSRRATSGQASDQEKIQEDIQQQELKKQIVDQLYQPAYHQQIKLALYQQLLSPTLSEQQRTSLTELTKLITAPEKKLRLGGDREIREAFRANPTPGHQLFEPLRNHLQKLANYQQEFSGTPIELLLKELIEKNQAFISRFVAQFQEIEGPTNPLKLFEAKPILQGEGFEAYEVDPEKAYQLACYSPHEYEYVRGNNSGLSIGSIQGGVYFKVDDGRGLLKPAKEHAVYTLYQGLGLGNLISPTHLVVMNGLAVLPADIGESPERRELQRRKQELNTPSTQEVFNHYPELEKRIAVAQHEYPLRIQGSLVVVGQTLEKFLEEAEKSPDAEAIINQLEPTSFSSHVLASLLLLPTDYKSDNLMVDGQNKIIGIDNDACLEAKELRELGDGKTHGISIKNILYLLPLMQAPVANDIRAKFINHHPGVLLLNWLVSLREKQGNYDKLLDSSLLDQDHLDQVKKNVEESLGLPLRFVPGWITGMYERFIKLQKLLQDGPNIKHQALFQAIHPFASRYYQGLKKLYSHPLDQMAFVYDKMGNLNTEISNDLESLLAKYPEPGDAGLFKRLSEADYQEKEVSLSIEQAIQELISNINLNAYTADQQLAWIERVVELNIWPTELNASWFDPALLIQMVQLGASPNVIQALIEKAGAQIDAKDESEETVLHAAVRNRSENAFKQLSILAQLGANLEAQNRQGVTPLDLAAEQNDIAVFKHLVMLGAGEQAIASITNHFYQSLHANEKQDLIPYITKLTQINPKVGWKISLNEIFPVQGKGKATLSTVTEGDRVISKEVWNSLFEKDGSPKKVNVYGARPVSFVEKNGQRIYVKFFPQLPGTELAVIRLAENLLGYCAPYCELASINGIPVLLTQGVPGETLYEVLQKDPERLKELDPESVSKALILAMLINPGDGNLGNYIVSPFTNRDGQIKYRLISIDNDQAFMPAVAKQIKTGMRSSTLSLQVKTILYCLDAMKEPVSQKLIAQIQEKDLVALLTNWLSSLKIHHEAAKTHFDSGLLKKYQEDKVSVIGVSFAPGMIKQLFTKLMRLQVALNKKTAPTHVELLSSLEPVVAHRYRSVLQDHQLTTIEKFKRAEHITEEQALTSSSNALSQLLVSREIPAIGELQAALWTGKFGPDQALQELKWVQEQHTNLEQIFKDLGKSKIQDIKELPASLLEKWLQEADLTKLSGPQQKTLLEAIQDQELTYVSLKNCASLTKNMLISFKLEQIKKLDVSGCLKLKSISSGALRGAPLIMPALTHLKLDESGIKAIRLQAEQLKKLSACHCSQLKQLELIAPQLNKLNLEGAAILDQPSYLYARGLTHEDKHEYKLAFHYIKQAAVQEHIGAQYHLGWMYEYGRGVEQDDSKAATYYKKAAEQGHIGSQWNIGSLYAAGKGVEKDEHKAQIWKAKADAEIRKWYQGRKMLEELKTSAPLEFTDYYDSFNIEQLGMLFQHPCFEQKIPRLLKTSSSAIRKLSKALPHSKIHTLDLCRSKIGTSGAKELSKALPHSQIHTLDLAYSNIGSSGAEELSKALPHSQIHTLDLRENNIGSSGAEELAKALLHSQIHTLYFSLNNIGTSGAEELAKALPLSQIHTLDLSYNNIGDSGAQELAKALPHSKIHTLNLKSNNIGDLGAQALSKVLVQLQIHALDLSKNNIGDSGAEELAKALANSQIHTLDLGWNNIADSGAQELTKVLTHSQIHALFLNYNNIGKETRSLLKKNKKKFPHINFSF